MNRLEERVSDKSVSALEIDVMKEDLTDQLVVHDDREVLDPRCLK
jgi:hypothetical protein